MKMPANIFKHALCLLAAAWLFAASCSTAHACSAAGCVSVGPRLASVDSAHGALLNAVLGSLTGSSLSLTVADWNTLAQGNISLLSMLNALQVSTNTSTPTAALSANATLSQLIGAAATVATGESKTALTASLNGLQSQLALVGGSVKLGDLLSMTGGVGTARVNVLDIVTGILELYNTKNVASTPTPIGVSTAALGLTSILTAVTLSAQIVEPPVYVCGPTGSQFHTASIRIKLNLDLLTLALDLSGITGILGINSASASVAHLDVYVEIARADGTIGTLNAIANSLVVQVTPGVADIYLGQMSDSVFFNRSHVLNAATDLNYGTVGSLSINTSTLVNIQIKTYARGQTPSLTPLTFTGSYPQSQTASTNISFASNFATSLITNLQVSLSPSLGAITDAAVLLIVKPTLALVVGPVLSTVLSSVVNPALELVGIRLGEVDVTADGVFNLCTLAGVAYNDVNHSARQEIGETGSGLTLYAKLVATSSPSGPAAQVVAVNTSTGAFNFTNVASTSYTLIVNGNSSTSDVTPATPTGWIATEIPTMSRSITISVSDPTGLTFGIYNGSKLTGTVFKDDGITSGTANNGIKDGGETSIAGAAVKVTDSTGVTVYDTTISAVSGTYTLWIPATAGANLLKVVEANTAGYVSVAGNVGNTLGTYTLSTDTVAFTNVIGSQYTGVNFADVLSNRFDPNAQQTVQPGAVAFYRHTFVAGSVGTVTLTSSAPVTAGWSYAIFLDTNCNGVIDASESVVTSSIVMSASQTLCIVARVTSPASASFNVIYPLNLVATFAYANSSLVDAPSRSDITITGIAHDAALVLNKAVDKSSAKSGDVITYTITYTNQGSVALTSLQLYDETPKYTLFNAATCGTLGTGVTACNVSTKPATNAVGAIVWQFTGVLNGGASGTVVFSVKVE